MKFGILPYSQVAEGTASTAIIYINAVAKMAENAGFDSVWVGLHHSAAEPFLDPLTVLTGLSQVTSKLTLGTGIIFPAFSHPLHLAETTATLDLLSQGRLILGVGIGYRKAEFDIFNIPISQRVPRMVEVLTLLRKLWTERSVNYRGRFYNFSGVSAVQPMQSPHPPIWIGAITAEAIRRAARIGDGWLISARKPFSDLEGDVSTYKVALKEYGRSESSGHNIAALRYASISETSSDAWSFAQTRTGKIWTEYKDYGADLFQRPDESDKIEGRMIIGTPDECIEQIEDYDRIGVEHLLLQFSLDKAETQVDEKAIKLFQERVIPYFRDQRRDN